MANPFDVAARLAEGRPVIDDVEEYVAACRRLGYQHRDLTMHSTQIRDRYLGEEGLDLRVLDSDHRALAAAASAAEDAARMQTDLVAQLDAAWSGRGATAAHEFVWRSCQSANAVTAAVRAAANSVATLRDALWRAVDAKVLATEAVDGRQQPQRAEWLAAAATVTTGAGDVAAASELVDGQVKPFVDIDVGSNWVAAMRDVSSSIDAAYDAAIAGVTAPVAVFGVPGALGPRAEPTRRGGGESEGRATAASPPTIPAAAVGTAPGTIAAPSVAPAAMAPPAAPAPAAPWSSPEPAPLPPPAAPVSPPAVAPSMPSMPSSGDLGAGTSSIGSGLSGLGQQLADLIGGLVGSADGPPEPTDPNEQDGPDEGRDEAKETDAHDDPVVEEDAKAAEASEEPAAELPPAAEPPPVPEPAPTPLLTPAPLPPEPPPAPQELPDAMAQTVGEDAEPTPCEIAADELPQVGE